MHVQRSNPQISRLAKINFGDVQFDYHGTTEALSCWELEQHVTVEMAARTTADTFFLMNGCSANPTLPSFHLCSFTTNWVRGQSQSSFVNSMLCSYVQCVASFVKIMKVPQIFLSSDQT